MLGADIEISESLIHKCNLLTLSYIMMSVYIYVSYSKADPGFQEMGSNTIFISEGGYGMSRAPPVTARGL